jgi:hypothetical protein
MGTSVPDQVAGCIVWPDEYEEDQICRNVDRYNRQNGINQECEGTESDTDQKIDHKLGHRPPLRHMGQGKDQDDSNTAVVGRNSRSKVAGRYPRTALSSTMGA